MQLLVKTHQWAIEPALLGGVLQRETGLLKSLSENTLPVGDDSKTSAQIVNVASLLPLHFHYRPKKKLVSSLVLRKQFDMQFLCCCLFFEKWADAKVNVSCQLRNIILWHLRMPQSAFGATFKPGVFHGPWSSASRLMTWAQAGLPSPASLRCCYGRRSRRRLSAFEGIAEESKLTSLRAVQANLLQNLLCLPHLQAVTWKYLCSRRQVKCTKVRHFFSVIKKKHLQILVVA